MEIHYSEQFDGEVFYREAQAGVLYAGDYRLLCWLEAQLGLSTKYSNTDYLRIELFRQALQEHLDEASRAALFYSASFEADPWATATALLTWRDALKLGGWTFEAEGDCPPRLKALARIEALFEAKTKALVPEERALGGADRFERVLAALREHPIGLQRLYLHEPIELVQPHLKRLIKALRRWNIPVDPIAAERPVAPEESDLAHWQAYLIGTTTAPKQAAGDGSLHIIRARRDSDAAIFLAEWIASRRLDAPVLLLPQEGAIVEQALLQRGCPSLGVPSISSARPSLQTLKLASAFLWEPVDVFKIMEFLTLPQKPFDEDLSIELARVLAEKPGLFSDTWFAVVNAYLNKPSTPPSARRHYDFWFARRRYPVDSSAPASEVADIFDYLHRWAVEGLAHTTNVQLAALAEQARQMRDILQVHPHARITRLDLDRIVRTVHEPAPLLLHPAQEGALAFVRYPGALADTAETLCWWNCVNDIAPSSADHWQKIERQWLQRRGVELLTPKEHFNRQMFFLTRPILHTRKQLVLFLPERVAGREVHNSLLISDLENIFDHPERLYIDLRDADGDRVGEGGIWEEVCPQPFNSPKLHLRIEPSHPIEEPTCETPTELEQLLYFPHRWFFRYKMRLYPGSLLSIARDQQLLGKLAHRFFEILLSEPECLNWDRAEMFRWIDQKAMALLAKEGATLLLYGREPERHYLLSRIKRAAWSLLDCLRADHWQIYGTEVPLEGLFCRCPLRGRADLVLHRAQEEWAIVDLKWSGLQARKMHIRNEEDLQLVLYSYLLPPENTWAHSAYFIIEEARLIARNRRAFRYATIPGEEVNHVEAYQRILESMEKTLEWRRGQIRQGLIELRYEHNATALDAYYGAELLDKLEMKANFNHRDEYYSLLWGGD